MDPLKAFRRFVFFAGVYDALLGVAIFTGWSTVQRIVLSADTLARLTTTDTGFLYFLVCFMASELVVIGIWLMLAARSLASAPRMALALVAGNAVGRAFLIVPMVVTGIGWFVFGGILADFAIVAGYVVFAFRARSELARLLAA
ncbi:MAG: hypothetical protein HYR72_21590 [Deltaproteobacteria bacterium]|nr:hypothetical protein [Deltaproteobacteria bacterium]MBI3390111.1 hypothetical protein [Deltaproteobacteria bacterium]